MAHERFRIDAQRIVHETIDDEVIIIDLETGTYFSLTDEAADLWPTLVRGTTRTEMAAVLAGAGDAGGPEIEAAITAFLDELTAEHIVTAEPGDPRPAVSTVPAATMARRGRPFEPPKLAKHTNMSDLLLLDPIHDVDEQGWPRRKSD